jgi:signal transduction histidine kinase
VISVTLRRRGPAATLAVRDFGEVIPPGELDLVFDRFYRADKARSAEGFGLGLSIAAEMAKLMGARLSAESSAEGGTVFRAELKCFSERGRGR